jgi:hypothetical protein
MLGNDVPVTTVANADANHDMESRMGPWKAGISNTRLPLFPAVGL